MTPTLTLIKPSNGEEAVNLYLKEVKKVLDLPNRHWKLCRAGMLKEIDEFREDTPNCTYHELSSYFGTPHEAAEKYIIETGVVVKERGKIRRNKLYKFMICASALLLVFSLCLFMQVLNDQSIEGAVETVIIDHR